MSSGILTAIGTIIAIVVVDLALSGDNALVIGAAAAKLPATQQRQAIAIGGVAAILLRVVLTIAAVAILQIPYIHSVGAVIVFIIGLSLVIDFSEESQGAPPAGVVPTSSFIRACLTIVAADISMSLDNVLAIAALSRGNYLLLAIGLILSIVLLLVASSLVAWLIGKIPSLLYLAGAVLAWVAATMVLDDKRVGPMLPAAPFDRGIFYPLVSLVAFIIISLGFVVLINQRQRSQSSHSHRQAHN